MTVHRNQITVPRPYLPGGGQWELSGLNHVTVIFGKNGSGKSVLLRSWRDSYIADAHYVAPERTGDMTFEPSQLSAQSSAEGRRGQTQYNFAINYRQQVVARITAYFAARGAQRGTVMKGDPDLLERLLNVLVPDFAVTLTARMPPYELMRITTGEKIAQVSQLSSGEAQILTVGLDVLTIAAMWELEDRPVRIMLIDEPDAHIHPDLQIRFADFLIQVCDTFGTQMVVSTHSTTLLAAIGQFGGTRTSVAYIGAETKVISARAFDAVQKEIAACLGGHTLMGPLFGAPLLLVEGDDDYRIWSQVPRYHRVSFAVIPSNGDEIKKYQKSLEALFAAVTEPKATPVGYALIDADKGMPTPNSSNQQAYVRFIQLGCHESENLYLTDEVLADLGIDWAAAITKIQTEAHRFGEKKARLAAVVTWNRKTVDLKGLMDELSRILDSKNVHWTVRVGRRLGLTRPAGQLEEFLGSAVVGALWGELPVASAA